MHGNRTSHVGVPPQRRRQVAAATASHPRAHNSSEQGVARAPYRCARCPFTAGPTLPRPVREWCPVPVMMHSHSSPAAPVPRATTNGCVSRAHGHGTPHRSTLPPPTCARALPQSVVYGGDGLTHVQAVHVKCEHRVVVNRAPAAATPGTRPLLQQLGRCCGVQLLRSTVEPVPQPHNGVCTGLAWVVSLVPHATLPPCTPCVCNHACVLLPHAFMRLSCLRPSTDMALAVAPSPMRKAVVARWKQALRMRACSAASARSSARTSEMHEAAAHVSNTHRRHSGRVSQTRTA